MRNAVPEMSNGVHRTWRHAASNADDVDEMNNNKNKNAYFNLVAASIAPTEFYSGSNLNKYLF